MRIQLARPDAAVLTPEQYNQLFSMHGVTMIFLYALPVLSGFSNYLWPLILGSRDMAFPRLNALSYWLYLLSGLFLYIGFPLGRAEWRLVLLRAFDGSGVSPGVGIDVYGLGLIFLGISTVVGSVNFLVSLLRMRAPGMSVNRLPILVYGTTTASVANLLAVPAVSLACFLLWMDRRHGTHFFEISGGGEPVLWQHLFWISGIRGSTRWFCRRWASSRTLCRCTAAGPWWATRWWRWRRSRRWWWASASGSTICSRPGCRRLLSHFFQLRASSSRYRRPSRCSPGSPPSGRAGCG